jgi:hypothetical protein
VLCKYQCEANSWKHCTDKCQFTDCWHGISCRRLRVSTNGDASTWLETVTQLLYVGGHLELLLGKPFEIFRDGNMKLIANAGLLCDTLLILRALFAGAERLLAAVT